MIDFRFVWLGLKYFLKNGIIFFCCKCECVCCVCVCAFCGGFRLLCLSVCNKKGDVWGERKLTDDEMIKTEVNYFNNNNN